MALTADAKPSTGGGGGDRTRFEFSISTVKPTIITPSDEEPEEGREYSRAPTKFRPISLKTGVISQANGSAFLEQGRTKVIASVYGPRPIVRVGGTEGAQDAAVSQIGTSQRATTSSGGTAGQEFSEEAIVTCDWRYSTFSDSVEEYTVENERELSMAVAQALELAVIRSAYPKSSIDVNIVVLQDDGSCLSSAITCAGLALANAGIQLYDLVPACTISISSATNELYLDPNHKESKNQKGELELALMPGSQSANLLKQRGELSPEQTLAAVKMATQGCQYLHLKLREVITNSKGK